MNALVTAHLPVEGESPAPNVRVPAETAEPFTERDFRKEGPDPRARLPGEVEEPSLGEGLEECSRISAPSTEERVPVLARPLWGRPRMLLLGAAVVALGAAGAIAFLIVPHNHASPVPQMASTLRHSAAEMGVKPTEPLAPAASLAGVPTEPAEAVTREKYQAKRKDQQLQEVLALKSGAPEGKRRGDQSANVPPAVTPPAPGQDAGASDREAPPPGYIPSEPGSNPAASLATTGVQPPAEAVGGGRPSPAAASSAPVTGEPPHDATTAVLASLGTPSKPGELSSSSPSPRPAEQTHAFPPSAELGKHSDAVETAGELRPAPLTPADQVQVLELVTQMAAVVRDLRAQHAQLRADLGKTAADNTARLADFERRLALAEARHALSAAQIAGEPLAADPPASGAAPAGEALPATGSSAVRTGSVTGPVVVTPVAAVTPASDKGPAKRYRVQAASPGLALLAEIDRGGGDGAQLEVLVGDTIPGYGKITAIGQRGTAWVVTTEHGNIQ